VPFPTTSKTRAALVIGIAATSALVIVGPGSTAATAGRLISSAAIKNNAVRSIDIRDETIRGRDVKDGSLTAKDFSGALRGATGPRGPAGPAGGGSTETLRTWEVSKQTDPSDTGFVQRVSTTVVPSGTQVEVVNLVVSGDFSACTDSGYVQVLDSQERSLGQAVTGAQPGTWKPAALNGATGVSTAPGTLRVIAACYNNGPAVVPTFDAVVTLALTKRDTTGSATFN
jgi:hypothetical protein